MSRALFLAACFACLLTTARSAELTASPTQAPQPTPDWRIDLIAQVPQLRHPSVVCSAPDGRVFVAEDPMDITAPADATLGRILCIHPDTRIAVFATNLHAVFGMQYLEGKLYVLHNPKFTVFTDASGVAASRTDLIESTNPNPWALGWNDHVPANFKLGMDGFFYVAVGDKGIFGAVGRDGKRVDLHGGGILRMRPDGTALEVFCSGVRNILDVAMNEEDEVFTYDNTDEQQWMGRVTHMAEGGFYGYPYDFIPQRPYTLWMFADYGGGAATGALCYNEDVLPPEYRGNLFLSDFGKRQVMRVKIERDKGTFRALEKIDIFPDPPADFRPVGIGWTSDGSGFFLCDWQHRDVKSNAEVGRLWKVSFTGAISKTPKPAWFIPAASGQPFEAADEQLVQALSHPSHAVRLCAQRRLAARGPTVSPALIVLLSNRNAMPQARWHALWALDAIDNDHGRAARAAILRAAADTDPSVRRQAIRQLSLRRVKEAASVFLTALKDHDSGVRFQAATALGRIGDATSIASLKRALVEKELLPRFAVFTALNRIGRADPSAWKDIALGLGDANPTVREGIRFAMRDAYSTELMHELAAPQQNEEARLEATRLLGSLCRQIPEWKGEWWAYHPVNSPPPEKSRDWAGTPAALEALTRALDDPISRVRLAAVEGLRDNRATHAAARLRGLFSRETEPESRAVILETLGGFKDPETRPLLVRTLLDRTTPQTLLKSAIRAAGELGGDALEALILERLTSPPVTEAVQIQALETLQRFKQSKTSLPVLARYATSDNPAVRTAALDTLSTFKTEPTLTVVLPLLEHRSAEVRRGAVTTVGRLGSKNAVPHLLKAFHQLDTRKEAIQALARLPDARAMEAYVAGLAEASASIRDSCRKAIRAAGSGALQWLTANRQSISAGSLAELRQAFSDVPEATALLQSSEKSLEPQDYLSYALNHKGDVESGKRLFSDAAGLACAKCHVVTGVGGRVGPDLSFAGSQFSRKELAESILFPSKVVREGYHAAVVETRGGLEFSGLSKGETSEDLLILDTEGVLQKIRKTDIQTRSTSQVSLMPEGLHSILSVQQFADLISFLESMKGR